MGNRMRVLLLAFLLATTFAQHDDSTDYVTLYDEDGLEVNVGVSVNREGDSHHDGHDEIEECWYDEDEDWCSCEECEEDWETVCGDGECCSTDDWCDCDGEVTGCDCSEVLADADAALIQALWEHVPVGELGPDTWWCSTDLDE